MKNLNAGTLINNYRILSMISQSYSEIFYCGYNTENSEYVNIKEFYPQKLNVTRVGTKVAVNESDKKSFEELLNIFKKSAELNDDNVVISHNNTLYIVSPQIIDTCKRDKIFDRLERIDAEYEIADLKGKSKNRLSALADYEEVIKNHPDIFYMHTKSVNNLADCYFYNYFNDVKTLNIISESIEYFTEKELNKKAFALYLQAAYRGSAYAQHQVGYFCDKGYGCICNYQTAAYWYSEAYNNGYKNSAKRLGDFYFYGQGVEQSYEKAVKYYEAITEKNTAACLMLAKCYTENLGVDADNTKVYCYLKKACELGDKDTKTYIKLAKCYITADGTDEDFEEANRFIKKAALARDVSGVSNLVNNVYFQKKIGFKNKVKCLLYKGLSCWDYILTLIAVIGALSALICLGLIFK